MARTNLTVVSPSTSGIQINASAVDVASDAVNGNEFDNDGSTFLFVRNSDSSSHVLTLNSPAVVDGTALPVKTVTIAASTTKWFGPFPPRLYNQSNNRVAVDSNSALMFFQCVRIPRMG
jgi:hypothetical protein